MFLVDVNLLVYTSNRNAPQHGAAKAWLEKRLVGHSQTLGLPWHSLLGFLRIVSNPRMYTSPVPVRTAWQQVQRWLDAPAAWIPAPGRQHRFVVNDLIQITQPAGTAVSDLHLAALAMENGLVLASADSDFGRIPGVRWVNPLAQR
jgi:toxin-antitoxin system PIN domain toxin